MEIKNKPWPILKRKNLAKVCLMYGIKRKFLESDKKLRIRTLNTIKGSCHENKK